MTIDELSKALGVSFPAGAKVVGIDSQHGIDDMLMARVAIDAAKLRDFEAASPVPAEHMEDNAGELLGPGPKWWTPSPSARVGQIHLPSGRALHIGIDRQRGNQVDIYVMNHGT